MKKDQPGVQPEAGSNPPNANDAGRRPAAAFADKHIRFTVIIA